MSKIKLVAIDLAKRCYQLSAIDESGKLMFDRKLSPARFALTMQQLDPTICNGSVRTAKAFRRGLIEDTHLFAPKFMAPLLQRIAILEYADQKSAGPRPDCFFWHQGG